MRFVRKLCCLFLIIVVTFWGHFTLQRYCYYAYGVKFKYTGCAVNTPSQKSVVFSSLGAGARKNKETHAEDFKETAKGRGTNYNAIGERLSRTPCLKKLLFWAPRAGDFAHLAKFSSKLHICSDINCRIQLTISTQWSDLEKSDAVIFHHKVFKDWPELIKRRPSQQIWIFYTRESPLHVSEKNNFPRGIAENVYNLTKVYLAGSDIPTIYGRFIPHSIAATIYNSVNWAENKTHLCAWIASNCKFTSWDRMGFVKALRGHMEIDVYGRCGERNCPDDCRSVLKKYMFYLALESNTCRDYITEKVWRNAFEQNIVPVVYGAPREDYERLLPPNSFIHVEEFASFNELAEYLIAISKDEERYNSYFKWKTQGTVLRETGSSVFISTSQCEIARKLVAVDGGEYAASWKNTSIKDWWEGSCFEVEKPIVYR